jgi:hypothetical protein
VLETPLSGRFLGENKKLAFAPPVAYDYLVYACLGVGAVGLLVTFSGKLGIEIPMLSFMSPFMVMVGLAGFWAQLSLQRIVFDLNERTYVRRDGPGFIKTVRRGRIDDIEALTLLAEVPLVMSAVSGSSTPVTYRLVIHWKGMTQPIMILQTDSRTVPQGAPLNAGAGPIHHLGVRYANALNLPFFDQAHISSPCPVPVF